MQLEKLSLSKTVTQAPISELMHSTTPKVSQAPSLQLAHSAAPVVLRDKLIGLELVCALAGVKKSTIYTWINSKDSDFPRPIRLSARMVRWLETAVLTWVQNRINQATAVQA